MKYLGSVFQDNSLPGLEIEKRISEKRRVISVLNSVVWSRNISHSTILLTCKLRVRSILIYGTEICLIKRKHKYRVLAREICYLRRSARISRMDRIRNETIKTKLGNEEGHITGNRRTATSCEWRTAELLDSLQNGTHRGNEDAADQSTRGRIGLGTACKAETSRMKNISVEDSGGTSHVFELRKTVYSLKFLIIIQFNSIQFVY
jgi:hypothetical protein